MSGQFFRISVWTKDILDFAIGVSCNNFIVICIIFVIAIFIFLIFNLIQRMAFIVMDNEFVSCIWMIPLVCKPVFCGAYQLCVKIKDKNNVEIKKFFDFVVK